MPNPVLSTFLTNPMFTVYELTASINRVPYVPGLIGSMNLFTAAPLSTTIALIEQKNNTLALVPELPRGAPPTADVTGRRTMVPFQVPHFPIDSTILADEIMGVRAFGSDNQLEAWEDCVQGHIGSMGTKLDVTLEWLRLGAVKGIVITRLDRDSLAVQKSINLFDAFGVQPQATQNWPIIMPAGGWTADSPWHGPVSDLCLSMARLMANELGGMPMGNIRAICGSTFFSALCSAPELRQIVLNTAAADSLRNQQWGSSISYRGVTFTEYRGQIGNLNFVAPADAYFFPEGVPGLWIEAYAPADYIESVNTRALPRYTKMEPMDFDKGVMLQSQMNVLPLCTIPRTLIHATATAGVALQEASAGAAGPTGGGQQQRTKVTA
jgi:hypothetical protein